MVLCMALSTSAALPMVLLTMIDLDVLQIIKRAGSGAQLSSAEIAAQLPAQKPQAPSMLDRLLRLLASNSVLTCSLQTLPGGQVERLYGLAPVCQFLTKYQDCHSLATHSLFFHDKEVIGYCPSSCWLQYRTLHAHTEAARTEPVEDGEGSCRQRNRVLAQKQNMRKSETEEQRERRVTHVGGDMFVSVPKGDAILIKSVFHKRDDEHCLKFMKNCYAALPDHGNVLACELYLPVIPQANNAARMAYHCDVFMMVSPDGEERTVPEYEALGKAAGVGGFRIACSAYDFRLTEFFKKN